MARAADDLRPTLKALAAAIGREEWTIARRELRTLDRAIPNAKRPKLTEDRAAWLREQMGEIALLVEAAGVRDVQGQARLRAEMRMLRDALDAETERQRQADTSGGTAHLEERLTEALSLIDDARLRRVLLEVERRKGVTLSDWLRDG